MKGTTKAKRLPADLQTAVDIQFQRSENKARRPCEHDHTAERCQKCTKYGLDCHTYCKFGIYEPYLLQVWLIVPNLQQVWQRCSGSTIMTTQLAAFSAALFRQHQISSTKAIKELQVFHTQNQSHPHDRWLCVSCVSRAQQAKALNKLWGGISH